MALTIASNVSSLRAQQNLGRANSSVAKSVERLSSGLKINRGADGPAALVISEKQRAQIAGLKSAIQNSEKAVSLVQTAEGALNEINSLLVKVRSLAIDSANTGVNDSDALAANQAEIDNALDTINRIANNTQFGTKKLLEGSAGINGTPSDADVTFLAASQNTLAGTYNVVLSAAGERATVSAGASQTSNLANAETLTVQGVSITLNAGLSRAQVIDRINEFTAQTGVIAEDNAGTTRLYTEQFGTAASISVSSTNAAAAAADNSGFTTTVSTDDGVDVAGTIDGVTGTGVGNVLTTKSGAVQDLSIQLAEASGNATATVNLAQGSIKISNNSLTFQIGPNKDQTATVAIRKINPTAIGVGVSNNQFGNLNSIDIRTSAGAQDSLGVIDQAIDDVTNLRGTLGAFQQNTLASTANNLRATLENTVDAESVIRDTDFAEEISNFTRSQVLVQAGTSVLSNANQIPQLVLSLLG